MVQGVREFATLIRLLRLAAPAVTVGRRVWLGVVGDLTGVVAVSGSRGPMIVWAGDNIDLLPDFCHFFRRDPLHNSSAFSFLDSEKPK